MDLLIDSAGHDDQRGSSGPGTGVDKIMLSMLYCRLLVSLNPSQGLKVEVQYHTTESLKLKEESHLIYVDWKEETDPVKAKKMLQQMDDLWTDFSPPPNYNDLP